MELNGQDKILGIPTTIGFTNPQNREPPSNSTSKLSSSSPLHHHHVNNTLIFNHPQTLDPFYHPQTHHNYHQPHQTNQHKQTRDHNQVPNPSPPSANHTIKAAPSHQRHLDPPSSSDAVRYPSSSDVVRYRECLKNHATSTGGHVLDGCGEFMPSEEEELKCAACECHRNFHRKEIEGSHEAQLAHVRNNYHVNLTHHNIKSHINPHHHNHHHHFPATSPTVAPGMFPPGGSMMTFGGGAAESSSEDLNHIGVYDQENQAGGSKKRFRTKFSQEQKERMMEVAEKMGWRIQKQDEHEMQKLCSELGVKRQVFKVWMHNNKQAMKKKQM